MICNKKVCEKYCISRRCMSVRLRGCVIHNTRVGEEGGCEENQCYQERKNQKCLCVYVCVCMYVCGVGVGEGERG